jgi:hypothetical protein
MSGPPLTPVGCSDFLSDYAHITAAWRAWCRAELWRGLHSWVALALSRMRCRLARLFSTMDQERHVPGVTTFMTKAQRAAKPDSITLAPTRSGVAHRAEATHKEQSWL